eukprot:19209-Heterococcus_DN1.PRE.1
MTPTSHAAACAVLTSLAQPHCTAIDDSLLTRVFGAHKRLRAKHLADVLITVSPCHNCATVHHQRIRKVTANMHTTHDQTWFLIAHVETHSLTQCGVSLGTVAEITPTYIHA